METGPGFICPTCHDDHQPPACPTLTEVLDRAIEKIWEHVNSPDSDREANIELVKQLAAVCNNEGLDCIMWLRAMGAKE